MLVIIYSSGFQITATWPVRASQAWRMRAMGSNALASYIVLACRQRPPTAHQCDRREFISELKKQLPRALNHLKQGNIAPVDLAQASIGPGMSVFSSYSKIIESTGNHMSVRTALSLINQMLHQVLTEQETEFDSETRWALAWFEQYGMAEGLFGDAETLCTAKDTTINGLVTAGIVSAHAGKVYLVKPENLDEKWEPAADKYMSIWKSAHYLIHLLDIAGESEAASILRKLPNTTPESIRDLAYRLYQTCNQQGWSKEALTYNGLIIAWPEISRLAQKGVGETKQSELNI
jgi:putative DNA methylase